MVRNYERKTCRGSTSPDVMDRAADLVIKEGRTVRSVAKDFEICHVTLYRFVKKRKLNPSTFAVGYIKNRQVFTDAQELELVNYIKQTADIFFGLSPKEVRIMAFQCAKVFNIKMPQSWTEKEQAGADWFSGFLKRHSNLSIRVPEATSMARATSFNKYNVKDFYLRLAEVIDRYKFEARDIWNVDETGVVTVQKPRNIVATKGSKQVGTITSAERGTLITMCAAICATGTFIPPMLIFPRHNYRDYFIRGGPQGCVGGASPSGWMNSQLFLQFLHHFITNVRPCKEKPVLLLLDNHESHLDIDVINYAKDNGVVLLAFPPHTSHKLQPLDRTVFGPMKKYVYGAQDAWMRNNPGKSITIYDLPEIISVAWPRAAVPTNVTNGFRVTGISPFNEHVFTDADFAPSSVTDRPDPNTSQPPGAIASDQVTNETSTEPQLVSSYDEAWSSIDSYLRDNQMVMESIPGDGHCLINAIRRSLQARNLRELTYSDLCSLLVKEFEGNAEYYANFGGCETGFIEHLLKYITERRYNTEAVDIVLPAFCNVLAVTAKIFQFTDGKVTTSFHTPGRANTESTALVYLAYFGDHYNAVYPSTTNASRVEDVNVHGNFPGNDTLPEEADITAPFIPENVRPFPKAGARKESSRGRKRRKSAILTDTPVKKALEEEKQNVKSKQKGRKLIENKTRSSKVMSSKAKKVQKKQLKKTNKRSRRGKAKESSSDDDDDCFCLVCLEPFSNSRPGEGWIQCIQCLKWSHEECTSGLRPFIYYCHNCDSDE